LINQKIQLEIQQNNILFDIENSNQYKEELLNILNSCKCLIHLNTRFDTKDRQNILEMIIAFLTGWIVKIDAIDHDFEWETNYVEIFNSFVILIGLSKVSKAYGNGSFVEKFTQIQMHPWLLSLAEEGWDDVLNVCLGS
jgi:hypothetical protein